MRQATHGVEIQDVPPEIKGTEFCIEGNKVNEIAQELQESIERDKERARQNPGGQLLARKFCNFNYYVGLQEAWESFEWDRMRPKGNESRQE
jgi:hypothetical protein